MQFTGVIFSVKVDAEGESKVTLVIPSSDLDKMAVLNQLLQKELCVTIEES